MTKKDIKAEASKIRKGIQTQAKRSPIYDAFLTKARKQNATAQGILKEQMIRMKKQGRGGISVYHNFKLYCWKRDLKFMDELEDMMRDFIHG